MKTEYIQLQVGDIIREGDIIDWDATNFKTTGLYIQPFWRMVNRKCPKGLVVHRKSFDYPTLTHAALVLLGEAKDENAISGMAKPTPSKKITLSALALDLLERKDREIRAEQAIKESVPTNATAVMPHAFKPRIVKEISESCTADFERIEKDYHGVQRTVEAITRCNQHHGLDALIKRRA